MSSGVKDLASPPNSSDNSTAIEFARTPWSRVEDGLISLWDFAPGIDARVFDVAPHGQPVDLIISDLNSVTWNEDVLLITNPVHIASPGPATKINSTCKQTGAVTMEAWVHPASTNQTGPARIATLSTNRYSRNLTMAQGLASSNGDAYSTRLRTTATDINGLPTISTPQLAVLDQTQHVVITRDTDEMVRIFVDGNLHSTSHRPGDFSNWDNSHGFAVGGEFTFDGGVSWLGKIHLIAIYDRALSATEVLQNMAAGPDVATASCGVRNHSPTALLASVKPNPFNALLAIEVFLAGETNLTLTVYNLRGQRVRLLENGSPLSSGLHKYFWDGTDDNGRHCSSGTYLVRGSTPSRTEVLKVVLAK